MSLYDDFRRSVDDGVAVAMATVIAGPESVGARMLVYRDGSPSSPIEPAALARAANEKAQVLLREERTAAIRLELPEGVFEVFVDVYPVPAQLIIVGATNTAEILSRFGKMLGYRVVVTDARAAFARAERFPEADSVLKGWPQDVLPTLRFDESTFVVLLSHDPKFDEPTLNHVLPTAAPYVGAIGSRKTQRERFERLRNAGFREEQLARIHGPVGLDLGGRSPEETALAIMAEVTAVRHGKSGGFMSGAR